MSFAEKMKQRLHELQNATSDLIADTPIAEARLAVCKQCPELFTPTNTCKKCGCFMNAKTRLTHASCPLMSL
jgi:hypothetical protein